MSRIRRRLPSPALVVAIIALIAATAGTTWAFGLSALNSKAKDKTVGVGKLTYVGVTNQGTGNNVRTEAKCPKGLFLIGGGVHTSDPGNTEVEESHPDSQNDWEAVVKANGQETIETIAICANSRVVKTVGTPLPPPEKP
jgi:hypothetical protein